MRAAVWKTCRLHGNRKTLALNNPSYRSITNESRAVGKDVHLYSHTITDIELWILVDYSIEQAIG